MVAVRKMLIFYETTNHRTPDLEVYKNAEGKLTVGIGHSVTSKDKLKIGDTIDRKQALDLFALDLRLAIAGAKAEASKAGIKDAECIGHLTMAIFRLGLSKWKKLKKARGLLSDGRFSDAADELAKSPWFRGKGMPKRVKPFQEALRRLDSDQDGAKS